MTTDELQAAKQTVLKWWEALEGADRSMAANHTGAALSADVKTFGPDPINMLEGPEAYLKGFWFPLRDAVRDLKRVTHLFISGVSNGRVDGNATADGRLWVSGTGVFRGTFENDYLGLPATGKPVDIRYGEFCEVRDSQIVSVYYLIDLIDLFEQAGIHVLPRCQGTPGLYPPPAAQDGLLIGSSRGDESAYSLQHIRRFIFDGLNCAAWEWLTILHQIYIGTGRAGSVPASASGNLKTFIRDRGSLPFRTAGCRT
jgi:SnoaL-like polyketide cyclase